MRLLYLYRYFTVGGTGAQLRNRLRYFGDRVEVHFGFLHDLGGRAVYGDYPYVHMLEGPNQVRDLIRETAFDVVTVIDTPDFYPALDGSDHQGVVINEVHGSYADLIDYLLDLKETMPMQAVLVPSEFSRQRILDEYGYRELCPVEVVPNIVDVEVFQFSPPPRLPERKVLLWVGRLDDRKNWRDFLEIARRLTERRDDCEFWIVGGKKSPAQQAEDLLQTASRYGLCDRLEWIQAMDYHAMPRLYSLASASGGCHVVTSVSESFGMTVAEAFACQCPVAATRVGGIPELMDEPHDSGLFEVHDTAAALAAIERVLDDPATRARLAQQGREKVIQRHAPGVAGAHYLATLTKILGQVDPSWVDDAPAPGQPHKDDG